MSAFVGALALVFGLFGVFFILHVGFWLGVAYLAYRILKKVFGK